MCFASIVLLLYICLPVYGEDLAGKEYLQKGKSEISNGRYSDAIISLTKAWKEFPVLGDYALLWLSDAYHETGDTKQSLETIRTLLKQYPYSSLVKKARTKEIQEAAKVPEENIQPLFESYMQDYPSDSEMKYQFALWLKHTGQTEKAKVLFKDIYREARSLATLTLQELDTSDIGTGDMLQHASNQIKQMNYRTAESVLRAALEKDAGSLKPDILKELGLALFKQKRYREAADIFRQAGEKYWEFRSLYRAGDKDALVRVLDDLLALNDKRIGSVLLAIASDRRRDGKSEDAMKIYQSIMEKFPSETEEALWGIGWTFFLSGEYHKASEVFSRLQSSSNDPKYLYWKIRSLALSGEEAPADALTLPPGELNFYHIMLNARAVAPQQRLESKTPKGGARPASITRALSPSSGKSDRVDALFELGFRNEAVSEMIHVSKIASSPHDLYYLCSKFEELAEYKYSVRLAGKIPGAAFARQFLYPLAYKDLIEAFSARYSIDPLLVLSIVREESRFDYEARSPAGAIGLMQLMPTTAFRLDQRMKVGIRHAQDLTDVGNNLHLGVYYLSALVREFGAYPQAIAAYNAGEDAVRKWLQQGNYKSADEFIEDIPYAETKQYVKRVLTTFFEYKRTYTDDDLTAAMNLGSM